MKIDDWTERFNGTRNLPRSVRDRLIETAHIIKMEKGAQVFGPSNVPDSLFFLYDGQIRVAQTSEGGREIVLYRVDAGESCVLTTACMLAEEAYHAEGIAETDIVGVILPRHAFNRLAAEEEAFRQFIFAAYSRRLIDLLRVVDEVAFGRIDMRLAARLLALAHEQSVVTITHQELASELGTAREVISRVLQDFQKREIISQSRGQITLVNKAVLTKIARSH